MSTPVRSFEDRLADHVEITGFCWLWKSALNAGGYGWVWSGSRNVGAHRWVYANLVGEPPEGMHLDHLCRVRRCVNPDHLEAVTPAENFRRSPLRKRKSKAWEGWWTA